MREWECVHLSDLLFPCPCPCPYACPCPPLQFKTHRELVAQQCTIVNNTSLIDIEKNYVHVEGVFEARQRAHRDVARGVLVKAHKYVWAAPPPDELLSPHPTPPPPPSEPLSPHPLPPPSSFSAPPPS